jgi:nucleoside-diphosphate-sugar epimerase
MVDKLALVTGGCGYSASWLIRELLADGWRVRATDLGSAPRDTIAEFGQRVEFVPGDITNKESLDPVFKDVDTVFHTAALFSYSAPMELLRKINVQGTQNVLDSCLKNNVKKMVMWSSVAVYGSASPRFYKMPITELPIDQMNPKNEGHYDSSKREQEALARKYWEEHRFPMSFMRLAPLYGPGSYYGLYALLRYVNEEVLTICPSNLGGTHKGVPKGSVPLVHAQDVARAAIFLSDPHKYNGEAFNVADDYTMDMVETLAFVANLTGSSFTPIIPLPMTLVFYFFKILGLLSTWEARKLRKKINGRPPLPSIETDLLVYLNGNFYFDNKKLKDAGFQFNYPDRRIGLIEAINWYNTHGWYPKIPKTMVK